MKKVKRIPAPPQEIKKLEVEVYCCVSIKSKAQKASLMNQIWCYTKQILNHDD